MEPEAAPVEAPPTAPTDAPPTAAAFSAWSLELEEKILAKIDANYDVQKHGIRDLILKLYQDERAQHGQPVWSAIAELQHSTHTTRNIVDTHKEQLKQHDEQHALHTKSIMELQKWRSEMAAAEAARKLDK